MKQKPIIYIFEYQFENQIHYIALGLQPDGSFFYLGGLLGFHPMTSETLIKNILELQKEYLDIVIICEKKTVPILKPLLKLENDITLQITKKIPTFVVELLLKCFFP